MYNIILYAGNQRVKINICYGKLWRSIHATGKNYG